MIITVTGPVRPLNPNKFLVTIERDCDDNGTPMNWGDDGAVKITALDHGGDVLCRLSLQFPKSSIGRRRIVVMEIETHVHPNSAAYGEHPPEVRDRVIYADILEMHHEFVL